MKSSMNSAIHFEIPADDFERAQEFYKNVFGWQINAYDTDTVMVSTTESGEDGMPKNPGAINGDLFKRTPDLQHPIIVLNVDSIDEHIKKIEAAGGKLRVPKGEIPEMGYYAYFTDSEGNMMGLWENWPESK